MNVEAEIERELLHKKEISENKVMLRHVAQHQHDDLPRPPTTEETVSLKVMAAESATVTMAWSAWALASVKTACL